MTGHGDKRSRLEEKAILCLLQNPNMGDAAKECGIGSVTLWRWMQDPLFQSKYKAARRQAVGAAVAVLQQATAKAVNALVDIVDNKEAPPGARVNAAKVILETNFKVIETEDILERLAVLEAALAGDDQKQMLSVN